MFAFIIGLAIGVWGTNTYNENQTEIQARIASIRRGLPGGSYSNGFPRG